MKQFEFACGGIVFANRAGDAIRIALDIQGAERNVNLRVADISRAMATTIPDPLLDVLEIAAYVYCADQHASRGSTLLWQAGADWRRAMRFIIPVRCPEIWTHPALADALVETLSFLSDDFFEFHFVSAATPLAQPEAYFPELPEESDDADEIALFSGGLDSLAGAVESIFGNRRRMVLVGHHSAETVFQVQKDLVWHLRHCEDGPRPRYVSVNVTNTGVAPIEKTQRTRSFLFASLAFVLARMFGKNRFTFFENGVVSLNLPIAGDVLGARATRTTHPRVIRGFETIFSLVAERSIEIHTPLLWSTKKDVVAGIVERGFGNVLPMTVSCASPRTWTRDVRHCGVCSQCIDRRFAILAAGANAFEPATNYAVDFLTGDRTRDQDAQMLANYVINCRRIHSSSRSTFVSDFPSVTESVGEFSNLSARDVEERIWELHRRHAENVLSVIEAATAEYRYDLSRGKLLARSLLSLCFTRASIQPASVMDISAQLSDFMDRLPPATCDFAVDTSRKRVLFKGGFRLNGADYKLLDILFKPHRTAKAEMTEVPFTSAEMLAEQLRLSEPSMRQQVSRTNKKIVNRAAVDHGAVLPDGFIENTRLGGYRISPEAREVSPADLVSSEHIMSRTCPRNVTKDAGGR